MLPVLVGAAVVDQVTAHVQDSWSELCRAKTLTLGEEVEEDENEVGYKHAVQ